MIQATCFQPAAKRPVQNKTVTPAGDAINDAALEHFQSAYPDNSISKEDLFYYIYGLLHSEDYREKYADNLVKQLPRIPRAKTYQDFVAFSEAGRDLAPLHLNYETGGNLPSEVYGQAKAHGQRLQ